MAITKKIEIDVKNNSSKAIEDINKLKTELKQTGNSAEELTEKLSKSEKATAVINGVGDAVGKLNPAFGSAIKGANGLILKMWEMVANPIGAILAGIVVTLKFLYEAFQSSIAGGKELKAMWSGLTATADQIKDAIFGLGRALISTIEAAVKFIKLDFKGASAAMKKANQEATTSFNQLGNAVEGTTAKIIYNLTKQQQSNDKARKVFAVQQSEINKLLVQSRETLTDETASINEKKKALDAVTKAEKKASEEKVRIAKEDLRIAQERAKAMGGEAEKKAKQELRDLTIALNEAETENAMTGIKLNKQRKMLTRQEVEDGKAAAEEAKQRAKERVDAAKEAYNKELESLKQKISDEKLTFEERRKLVLDDVKITAKDKEKLISQINAEEKKAIEAHQKELADVKNQLRNKIDDMNAKTDMERLDLEDSRERERLSKIAKTNEELYTLMSLQDEIYTKKRNEILDKNANEEINKQIAKNAKQIENSNLEFQTRYDLISQQESLINSLTNISEETRIQILEENAKKRNDIVKAEAEFKEKTYRDNYNNLQNILSVGGKEMQKISKTLAIADIVRTSYNSISSTISSIGMANAKAVAASPLTGGMPYVAINTIKGALSIGSTIANAAKSIQAINGDAKSVSGGGGNAGSSGGGGGSSPAPQFNVVGNSGINQIASTIGQQQPIQAYVVANNVTTAQAMNRNIIENASIG